MSTKSEASQALKIQKSLSGQESIIVRDHLRQKRKKKERVRNKELLLILSLSLIWRAFYIFLFLWVEKGKISSDFLETSLAVIMAVMLIILAQGMVFFFLKSFRLKFKLERPEEHHFFLLFHFIILATFFELYIRQMSLSSKVEALLWIQLPCLYFTTIYNRIIQSFSSNAYSWLVIVLSTAYLLIRSQMSCLNIVEAINQAVTFMLFFLLLYRKSEMDFELHLATYKKLRIYKLYRRLFEILPEGVALFEEESNIIASNFMFNKMFPRGEGEFMLLENQSKGKNQDCLGENLGSLIKKKEYFFNEQKKSTKNESNEGEKLGAQQSLEDPDYNKILNYRDDKVILSGKKNESFISPGNKDIAEKIERNSFISICKVDNLQGGADNFQGAESKKESPPKYLADFLPPNKLELFSRMNSGASSKESNRKKVVRKTSLKARTSQWGSLANNKIEVQNNDLESMSGKLNSADLRGTNNFESKSGNNIPNSSNRSISIKKENVYKITSKPMRKLSNFSEKGKLQSPQTESPTKQSKRNREPRLTLTVDEELHGKSPYHFFYDKEKKKHFYIKFLPVEMDSSRVLLASIREYESEFEAKIVEKINNFQSKFFSSVSHELRTPLNGAISLLTILGDNLSAQQNSGYLEPALNSLKLLLFQINDILDYQRIHSNRFSANYHEFELKVIFDNIEKMVRSQIQERNVVLSLSVDESVPSFINSDSIRITQIIINLLTNSIKFSNKGKIQVTASADEENRDLIKVSVKDEGIGISDKQKRKLFRFDAGNSSGMIGLGLTISDMIARRLSPDGKGIRVESELGKGSVFSFFVLSNNENNREGVKQEQGLNEEQNESAEFNPERGIKKKASWNTSEFEDLMSNMESVLPRRETALKEFKFIDSLNVHSPTKIQSIKKGLLISEESFESLKTPSKKKLFISNESISRLNSTFRNPSDVMISYHRKKNDIPKSLEKQKQEIETLKLLAKNKKCQCPDILIVDDSDLNIYALKLNLNKFHMIVATALNGEEGVTRVLDLYKNSKCCRFFKLIFMDLNMPVKDGFEAAAEISEFYKQKHVNYPILACTANAGEDQNARSIQVGMNDFVTKPVTASALEVILLSWMDRKHFL